MHDDMLHYTTLHYTIPYYDSSCSSPSIGSKGGSGMVIVLISNGIPEAAAMVAVALIGIDVYVYIPYGYLPMNSPTTRSTNDFIRKSLVSPEYT